MKECCQNKLEGVLILLKMRADNYANIEKGLERNMKKNRGNTDAMAKHLAVISYQKELKTTKEMIEIIIKEGI